MKNKNRKIYFLPGLLVLLVGLSGCGAVFREAGDAAETADNTGAEAGHASETVSAMALRDKDTLYKETDRTSVVTMYLTVSSGNRSENTNHTWTEVNSYSVYDYENMGVERYAVNGLLQVGDEYGPAEGELGYGQVVPNATVTIRGQTSSLSPQKNYKITIGEDKGTWENQQVINLNKHVGDSTRFANKLSYDLMTELPGMMALRTRFVHLYVKDTTEGGTGEFEDYGLYTQVEQLNKRGLENHGLDKNGQLYKINFFEFFRYEDVIRLKSDADYDVAAFEERLEIKGDDDHSKLIAMLEDVNDYSLPIQTVMDTWFDEENLFSWLAFHMLMGNVDTQSRNTFLYSPLNGQTWYFISWDNDGAFTDTKNIIEDGTNDRGWEKGISNYWGNVLFQRILKDQVLRERLNDKIEEYRSILTQDKLEDRIADYAPIVKKYAFSLPDSNYMPLTLSEYETMLSLLPSEVERNYAWYQETLTEPMPFYIGVPVKEGDTVLFVWDTSFDFDAENIYYSFELARDCDFEETVVSETELFLPRYQYEGTLAPGQYFVRVKAKNESGKEQYAFDNYVSADDVNHHGVRCFYVMEDGRIEEEVYE